jgi:hypothetical protein
MTGILRRKREANSAPRRTLHVRSFTISSAHLIGLLFSVTIINKITFVGQFLNT